MTADPAMRRRCGRHSRLPSLPSRRGRLPCALQLRTAERRRARVLPMGRTGDVGIPLWKFGAVGGTVLDENGDPLVGAQVRILAQSTVAGKRQLQSAGTDTSSE